MTEPRTILHYRLAERLGAGGMGEVYAAEDVRLGRRVALKLLPASAVGDADCVRRFEQEARAVSTLNHPNIVMIFDIGVAGGTHFIALELVEGRTLRALMADGVNPGAVASVAVQVARALSAAHAAGIVHRDIKPENIMVRHDGYVKVLDFGLARLTQRVGADAETDTVLQTQPGIAVGTLRYMSPEQARGEEVTAATDIFSFGVVLYELATGERGVTGG